VKKRHRQFDRAACRDAPLLVAHKRMILLVIENE
jgi:hypothetical protein